MKDIFPLDLGNRYWETTIDSEGQKELRCLHYLQGDLKISWLREEIDDI